MSIARPKLSKFVRWSVLAVVGATVLPLILLAGLLIIVAPLPQLAIHVSWCYEQPGPLGFVLLLLGAVGVLATLYGLIRSKAIAHRVGFFLVVVPIVAVAFHHAIDTDDWGEIPLLAAFLFGTLLIYLTASEGM